MKYLGYNLLKLVSDSCNSRYTHPFCELKENFKKQYRWYIVKVYAIFFFSCDEVDSNVWKRDLAEG